MKETKETRNVKSQVGDRLVSADAEEHVKVWEWLL